MTRLISTTAMTVLLGITAIAAPWPEWRGPNLNGSTSETNLPTRWSRTEGVAWVSPLPGKSGATPVVWEESIFLPSPDDERNLWLFCLETRTGAVRWRQPLGIGDRSVAKNNMTSSSAATDGRRVYAISARGELAAFDFAGQEVWRRDLSREYGRLADQFLYGSSPLLFDNRLYVQVLQRNPPTYGHALDDKPERDSYLLCLDPATGTNLWRTVRRTDAVDEAMEAYTTPLPRAGSSGPEIVLVGANAVTAHRVADGQETWRFAGLNLKKILGGRIVPSPVIADGIVFACGPKRERLVALNPAAAGSTAFAEPLWQTTEFVPDVCTPLAYRGRLFVLDGDRQVLTCYDPRSGRRIWQGRLGVREVFSASPLGADGRLYCLSDEGTVVIVPAEATFRVEATIAMGEGPSLSSIVASQGHLFLRTSQNLYAIGPGF